ncbi:MAG TPA: hypothetical protein VHZ27_19360, partial [Solirubrobacteraceae bacterium]|nr:hypothetical protein [Solirubrobacteraceae bacterium]
MRPPASQDGLLRFLTVVAFAALLVSPVGLAGAVLFAMAAMTTARAARLAARRFGHRPAREGMIALGV